MCVSVCVYIIALSPPLLCFAWGLGLPSRAGALPHPSFGMDGLGLYGTVRLLFEGEFPLRVGSEAPDLANT